MNRRRLNRLRQDRKRLEWLINNGYTPAKWRSPRSYHEYKTQAHPNGLIFEGRGGREEIDEAMSRPPDARPKCRK